MNLEKEISLLGVLREDVRQEVGFEVSLGCKGLEDKYLDRHMGIYQSRFNKEKPHGKRKQLVERK